MKIPTCPFDALMESVWQYNRKEMEKSFIDLLNYGKTHIKELHGRFLRTYLGAFQKDWQDAVQDLIRQKRLSELSVVDISFEDIKKVFSKDEEFSAFLQRSYDEFQKLTPNERVRLGNGINGKAD